MNAAGQRVFERQRIWRVTERALTAACVALADAVREDHLAVSRVIGIANGGVIPAGEVARHLGVELLTVRARHNIDDRTYLQATGEVEVEQADVVALTGFNGTVLVVDDICGSGATLRALAQALKPVVGPGCRLLTATLCLNAGARLRPDYWIWPVSDWVNFPWEQPPAAPTSHLPYPEGAHRDR
ncbi:phosphoribosyltransferase [Actinosynnema pretiosum subsp. pretiosum]|uniref:Phosphoribosyltransferase n=1 Tax=Actinosynnema pretiosum subsp. pretiosum TaxID=103721 RepID=A0AA45L6Z4_9PSEU|nr:Xanthine-guanine phosphoribosyltransferase [Actinosynnema pretiosum subsp. pretiosum]QUF04734.1 phosphoribosyltransferase [Actinosynnema pretiosum subsp. pretiosum]